MSDNRSSWVTGDGGCTCPPGHGHTILCCPATPCLTPVVYPSFLPPAVVGTITNPFGDKCRRELCWGRAANHGLCKACWDAARGANAYMRPQP